MIVVDNPIRKIYKRWSAGIAPLVGTNCSMEISETVAKTPYARIYLMGAPGARYDLENNEAQTRLTIQSESFAEGEYGIEDAYDIDAKTRELMLEMGFRCYYGPQLIANSDTRIKRVISRYTRNYSGTLLYE